MPKNRFALSKKHEKLIDVEVNIPTLIEMRQKTANKNWSITDHRGNAEDSLMIALETISIGTQYEEVCKNIIDKCQNIFEYYDNKRLNS